ncbi:MAG: glycoside hydrolase family 11 protein [Lachnospiraceae bacterium]|nr:glycoside hydrolase family 11 protein [Lachnospiraceae bacterium]
MKKLIIAVLIVLLCCGCPYMGNNPAKAATVLTESREGRDGEYTYSLWKDYGDTSMTIKGDGKFECFWKDIGNALFREGVKFDCTKKYQQIGDITVEYDVDYHPDGNSYMCVYGWTRDPLVEYYIVDSWGSWRPPGATSKGTIGVDGGTYDIYETVRENQPSIDGNTTFKQYWSVRTSKRTKGTISVTEHFKAWEKLGMQMGNLYESCLTIEGYRSNGSAEVNLNKVTIGNTVKNGGDGGKNDGDGNNGEKEVISTGNRFECESMTLSGPYAGNTWSPFSGVALYANGDTAEVTVNLTKGLHDFTLRGVSDGSNKAKVDLVIGDETKGIFTFNSTDSADKTIKNISTAAGKQTVKLVVTADDGTWDVFLDSLTIEDSAITVKKPKCSANPTSGKNAVKITTAKADYADGFYIYMRKSGEKNYHKVKKISKNGSVKRSCTIKNLEQGKYYIKIKAYVKSGGKTYTGKYSKTVSIEV